MDEKRKDDFKYLVYKIQTNVCSKVTTIFLIVKQPWDPSITKITHKGDHNHSFILIKGVKT